MTRAVRSMLVRVVLVGAVVGGVIALRQTRYAFLTRGVGDWARDASPMIVRCMAIAAEVSLALMLVALYCVSRFGTNRGTVYDRQLGASCGRMIAGALVISGVVLGVAMYSGHVWLVLIITVPTICFGIMLIGGLIAEGIKAMRQKRARNRDASQR